MCRDRAGPTMEGPPDRAAGEALVGTEVLMWWDRKEWASGTWHDAIVVRYYEAEDEHKLVYREDDGIEICKLSDRRWVLAPKKRSSRTRPVFDGCIIEFTYPGDGQRYKAMIYDYSRNGKLLKIAYLDDHTTDNIRGGEWKFLTRSPCEDKAVVPSR